MIESGLYVVATPIGNLEDISPRAVRILAGVDRIAAEDTRHTLKLLAHYGIRTPLTALHEHNESHVVPGLIDALRAGGTLALVSDAGTPLVSDPGFRLVRAAHEHGVRVFAVAGPSAVTAALSVAGLPTDRFAFEGFLPAKSAPRRRHLESLRHEARTLVFFESSHRILGALSDMAEVLGSGRSAAVCRELTKQFETVLRGDLGSLVDTLENFPEQRKGEFVVLVEGCGGAPEQHLAQAHQLAQALTEFLSDSQAARVASRLTGASRRSVYERLRNS